MRFLKSIKLIKRKRFFVQKIRPFSKSEIIIGLIGLSVVFMLILIGLCSDNTVYHAASGLPAVIYSVANAITVFGKADILLIPMALFLLFARFGARMISSVKLKQGLLRMRLPVSRVFFTVICTGAVVNILKYTIGRARPKLYDSVGSEAFFPLHIFYTGKAYDYASMPSGHTATAFAFAFALGHINPRFRIPLFIFAAAIGASRILLGAHYFSDVIAGFSVALIIHFILSTSFFYKIKI